MAAQFNGLLLCALAVTAASLPSAAPGQCRLCETPTVERPGVDSEESIRIDVEASLDFDRLVVTMPGEGSATLRPDGSSQVSGNIAAISGRAMVGSARIEGQAGRAVRIELPPRIDLHSADGSRIAIEEIYSDLPPTPRLDSGGRLSFRFGGRLHVEGDASGDYRGDIPITVEYL